MLVRTRSSEPERSVIRLTRTLQDHSVDALDLCSGEQDDGLEDEVQLSNRVGADATDTAFIFSNQHPTDTNIVNAMALMLGTQREWNGGDTLEDIANLIGLVRQHPGNHDPAAYVARFAH